jgi:hypothetical protein
MANACVLLFPLLFGKITDDYYCLDVLFTFVCGTDDDCIAIAFILLVIVACAVSRGLEAISALA